MHPQVERLNNLLKSRYPYMSAIVEVNEREFGPTWSDNLGSVLETYCDAVKGPSLEQLVKGYAEFSIEVLLNHSRFEDLGHYVNSSYAEARENYYDNQAYMSDIYMPAVVLSHYLWPHHYRLLEFFRRDILNELASHNPQRFCEVGVGPALYSVETLKRMPQIQGIGYDISQPALDFGSIVVDRFGLSERFKFEQRDILVAPLPEPYDFLICQEVLEHLEDPAGFCVALASFLKPGGYAYVTAALTAGHADHIFLFRTIQEVYDILEQAGLEPLIVNMDGARTYNLPQYRPRVVGLYCRKSK